MVHPARKGKSLEAMPRRAAVQALSTGQAARFCYVTSETILNWIRSSRLKAQRTAGGQHRILLEDLRDFMHESGMSTALLDTEKGIRPYCWEFHCRVTARDSRPSREVCELCLVNRSGTLNCWELHGLLPVTRRRFDRCLDCEYCRSWASSRGNDE